MAVPAEVLAKHHSSPEIQKPGEILEIHGDPAAAFRARFLVHDIGS
jgi:hypothetical protein